ncbi:uncharacterized protein DUF4134 [Chitinophaga niastensis]|uniref:Uncharacterized protein DUF4134 n=1 Tax=Chitinophaga niastensis TaxID=536980 RepID=A0A2P8H9C4_CHINA|nr:DUF4134 domain-containing protein [Chitinophaga niastensis]PSL42825.1 uncharacterized protein DUF4134 [Chitinophaga niastensis]
MCSLKSADKAPLCATVIIVSLLILISIAANAQDPADGGAGIDKATELVKGYFEKGILLLYAIGAVLGLVGAVKVYSKWSSGDPDTSKTAASWFGSCIFLVVVATVLKSFFGI